MVIRLLRTLIFYEDTIPLIDTVVFFLDQWVGHLPSGKISEHVDIANHVMTPKLSESLGPVSSKVQFLAKLIGLDHVPLPLPSPGGVFSAQWRG